MSRLCDEIRFFVLILGLLDHKLQISCYFTDFAYGLVFALLGKKEELAHEWNNPRG